MIVFIYLLKLVSCMALFYGYYYFFLHNKQIHQYNRFYILTSVVLSIALPLLRLPLLSSGNEEESIRSLQGIAFGGWENEIVITAKQSFLNSVITAQNILFAIYVTGFLLAAYPIVRSLGYIYSLATKHRSQTLNSIRFYDTTEPGTPFSFFNTVFWNLNIPIETDEGQQILRHELYHVRQKHSYDILFMQLACSLLWFNPFCHLFNKELKIIHEFLADDYAVAETDRHQYAKLLVLQAASPKQIFISNQFFYTQIKRRITMVLRNNNTRYSNIRKVMAIPVVLLIFCACSVKNKDEDKFTPVAPAETSKIIETPDSNRIMPPIKVEKAPTDTSGQYNKIFTKVEIEPSFPQGPNGWKRFLNKTFKYPQAAQENEIQGTVIIQFIVDKEGNVSDVEAIAGPVSGGLREEAVRVIRESGKWLPAYQNGRKVSSYKKQPITFKLESE